MWTDVGPFRTRDGLERALAQIRSMRTALANEPAPIPAPFANEIADWHELRSALLTAEAVAVAALAREESRGAHQRNDFPHMRGALASNPCVRLVGENATVDPIAPGDRANPS